MDSLCKSCVHVREVVSGSGSRFFLCQLSQVDKRYPKYPPQPLVRCDGHSQKNRPPSSFRLELLAGSFAICRLSPQEIVPAWVTGDVVSVTRTAEELSIVCCQDGVPADIRCEAGWCCLRVVGPLDFSMVGVIASLTGALALANISTFVISTFDTDYLLAKQTDLDAAVATLAALGHVIAR